ncbi:hypothetical protein LOTGIDRAFT_165496 [Lottia gigantea]|uniref:MULE transposase domain-containing protein n=1 Tax=Lottia gigantea TaxID=225164 RepID=V4A601_LOTGI|nr:hypothetical protein LOTGIDRAFT_165496 [Lottia gigantea]ESO88711.1 hypothetical protein LOTGIDRAFT_165496 [Lottia gigantea]
MVKEELSRFLQRVNANLLINVLATDRHIQVGCMMRKKFPQIIHQFDVWHVSKAIIKKLTEKTTDCAVLWHWIGSIKKHFWWSVASCDGNLELLKEKWRSVLQHCVNVHHFECNNQFHACAHQPLTEMEQKKKKWSKPSSPAYHAIQDIIFDNSITKSLEKLTLFCHTGDLEVYHSMMLKYCPKRQHFSYDGMVARTQLAALDHNYNTGRKQATSSRGPTEGALKFNQVFPKRCKTWVAQPIPDKNKSFVQENFNVPNCRSEVKRYQIVRNNKTKLAQEYCEHG